ncbi:MAG: hypothetical protein GY711_09105 [bacterium]|nr:hypothetical protein [bacterium]
MEVQSGLRSTVRGELDTESGRFRLEDLPPGRYSSPATSGVMHSCAAFWSARTRPLLRCASCETCSEVASSLRPAANAYAPTKTPHKSDSHHYYLESDPADGPKVTRRTFAIAGGFTCWELGPDAPGSLLYEIFDGGQTTGVRLQPC